MLALWCHICKWILIVRSRFRPLSEASQALQSLLRFSALGPHEQILSAAEAAAGHIAGVHTASINADFRNESSYGPPPEQRGWSRLPLCHTRSLPPSPSRLLSVGCLRAGNLSNRNQGSLEQKRGLLLASRLTQGCLQKRGGPLRSRILFHWLR